MASPTDTLSESLNWFRHVGVVLLAHYVLTAIVTATFRQRTPEELAKLAERVPLRYKALMFAKTTGLDTPVAWKWILSLLFARTLRAAEASAQEAGVPVDPAAPAVPPLPPLDGPHG